MAASPREFKIEYDTPAKVTAGTAFSIGDTAARQIHSKDGPIRIERSWDSFSFELSFVIVKDTAANFQAEVDTVEEALRTPYNRLRVTMAGQVQYDFDPSTASGFDIALSRSYRVRFEVGLPADLRGSASGSEGLRFSTVDVSYTPARRRTITISGEYTGTEAGEVDARGQYEDQIDAYSNAVLAAIDPSADFELTEEPRGEIEDTDLDDTGLGRVISFTRVFKEIIYSQGGSSNDSSNIVDQEFNITRRREAPGDSVIDYPVLRLVVADISYTAWIDKDETQDLKAEWDDTIRDWIIAQTKTTLAKYIKGGIAIVAESVTFEWDENRINATMTAQALAKASTIIERRYTSDISINPGVVLVPVWSGDQYAKYKYNGPATKTVTVTDILRLDSASEAPANMAAAPAGFEDAVLISSREAKTPLTMGMGSDNQIKVDEYSASKVFEVFNEPAGGGGGLLSSN